MEHTDNVNKAAGAPSVLNVGLGAWISVDDALPKPKIPCLTFTTEGRCEIRKMNAHKFSEFFGNRVTHWMPLPEAPNVQIEALPASGQSLSNAGLGVALADQRRKFGAEIDDLHAELKRVREVAAAEISLLRRAARLIHERRKMGSGSVAMFECDAICKKAGLEVWTWPL